MHLFWLKNIARTGGSKTQVTGHCFTNTVTALTPLLMPALGLSATIRQCFRPKHTKTIFRLKISISKGLGCSSKTMTRDLCFRSAKQRHSLLSYRDNLWVSQAMLDHNRRLFLMAFRCFCFFGDFAKDFWRKVYHVQVAHLQSAARALSLSSPCFHLWTNLEKDLSRHLLCWDYATIYTNATRLLRTFMCVSSKECMGKSHPAKLKYIDKQLW